MTELITLSLDDHLCFSLYAASRAILRIYRPYLDDLHITYPQYLVLLVLWEDKQVSVKSLGARLDLDSGTLTPMLKRMETSGLIKRVRSTKDERVVEIYLTEEGERLKEKATCVPQALMDQVGLTEKEIKELNETVKKLLFAINEETE